jgi:hypothetical protein
MYTFKTRADFAFIFLLVFVFFNTFALPQGLLYTSLLSPVFYVLLIKRRARYVLSIFFIYSSPFLIAHLFNDQIRLIDYFQSYVVLLTLYVTMFFVCYLINRGLFSKGMFVKIIWLNFIFCLVALILPTSDYFWSIGSVTRGVGDVSRLKMFVYEPSYYSMLLVPFFVFSFVRLLINPGRNTIILFSTALFPLILSMSFGVISVLFSAIFISSVVFFRRFIKNKIFWLCVFLLFIVSVFSLFGDSLVSVRIANFLAGEDSSGNNRVFESPLIAYLIAESTNLFFGAGLGQPKYYAPQYFEEFWPGLDINRLTNSVADTLAALGVFGLIFRFSLEIYFFVRTKVFSSYYRLIIFIFIFIYQFTGSFLSSSVELFIWILSFNRYLDIYLGTALPKDSIN